MSWLFLQGQDLVYDNHPVEQPASPEDGYHPTTDLADKALEFIRDAKAVARAIPQLVNQVTDQGVARARRDAQSAKLSR